MTFDYVTKNGYKEYNEALSQVPDDPSTLKSHLQELKASFKTKKTHDYNFRMQQLQSLMDGLEEMKDDICKAIEKDLGRGVFFAYLSEIHLCRSEIQHTMSHLK